MTLTLTCDLDTWTLRDFSPVYATRPICKRFAFILRTDTQAHSRSLHLYQMSYVYVFMISVWQSSQIWKKIRKASDRQTDSAENNTTSFLRRIIACTNNHRISLACQLERSIYLVKVIKYRCTYLIQNNQRWMVIFDIISLLTKNTKRQNEDTSTKCQDCV